MKQQFLQPQHKFEKVCCLKYFSKIKNVLFFVEESTSIMMTTSKPLIVNERNLLNKIKFECIKHDILLECFSPRLTLIPGISSLSSPLEFRRNQDFYISSNIELNCNISLSTITQWTVSNCTSVCLTQIPMSQSVVTTLSELYVPARTLAYGIYELKLTVTMSVSSSLSSSASVYIEIQSSGITANLVQLGTSMITSGYEQDLKLDPGTFSVDPDESVFNGSVRINNKNNLS
jgi:REJ domain